MTSPYYIFENLLKHNAQLVDSVQPGSGLQLAFWTNENDTVTQRGDHHTLSLYVTGGHETYRQTANGWRNGGGPDRFCLMPANSESKWNIGSHFSFVHLYCTDKHLRGIAEQIWDRSPAAIALDEKTFASDERITQLYRHFLLNNDWQQRANHLTLSTASMLLLTHLVQHYSTVNWQLPTIKGGLSPTVLHRIQDYIEHHLDSRLTLEELALQAGLSEFHFARMFKQSTRQAPHQYVMQRRMIKAKNLVCETSQTLTEIALACGFSSSSHFSNRFKAVWGITPSGLRAGLSG